MLNTDAEGRLDPGRRAGAGQRGRARRHRRPRHPHRRGRGRARQPDRRAPRQRRRAGSTRSAAPPTAPASGCGSSRCPNDYRKRLDSDVADLRNISRTNDGGAITAALFLREFVGEGIPWAHLDIAGGAWSNDVDGELAKGGTGFGVRTILELARTFTKPR